MTPEAIILRVLLALQPYNLEPADPTRAPRMALLAAELARFPSNVVAGLIDIGRAESQFARYVAEGCYQVPKGAPDCDRHTALGYWQLKRSTYPTAWVLRTAAPDRFQPDAPLRERQPLPSAGPAVEGREPQGTSRLRSASLARS